MKQSLLLLYRFWSMRLRPWLPAVGQLLMLLVVALALLWPAPFTSDQLFAIIKGSDLAVSHWPADLFMQRTFARQHLLPFWNPYYGGGLPLAANPLAAFFYPPIQLVHILPLREFYLVLVTGHLVLAGLGMVLLARRVCGLSRCAALVAAVSDMATPKLLAHLGAGHMTMVQTVAWYPWLALACWATVREPRRWGGWFSLCLALTLLAGHPQMAYYAFLMIASLGAWMLLKRWKRDNWRARWTAVAYLFVAAAIGLLLAAIYLLPLLELIHQSSRQGSINVGDALPLSSFLRSLISQPAPGTGWETMVAPGWSVLALALLALVTRWRKVWPLLLGIGLVATLTLGNASPIYIAAAHTLPELASFRGVARIWFVALLQMSLLAGIGSEVLLRGIKRALDGFERLTHRVRSSMLVAGGSLVMVVVVLSLLVMDVGYTHVGNASLIATPSRLARTASQLAGTGKVYAAQENILQANAVELSMPLADGQDPLLLETYISYMQRAGGYSIAGYNLRIPYESPGIQPDARLLGLMDVSVVVSRRPLTDTRLVLLTKVDNTLIYRDTVDAGPAYLVGMGSRGNPPTLNQLQQLKSKVRMVARNDEQSVFAFSASAHAYLVLAATAYPGWTATLDGQAVPIQLIAGVLPAIKVGPGVHTLSYSYSPLSMRYGALGSASGLLAVLAWFFLERRRRQKGRKEGVRRSPLNSSCWRKAPDAKSRDDFVNGATDFPFVVFSRPLVHCHNGWKIRRSIHKKIC